jgi:hypothetical protein
MATNEGVAVDGSDPKSFRKQIVTQIFGDVGELADGNLLLIGPRENAMKWLTRTIDLS